MVDVVNQFPNEVAADGSKPNHQERGCVHTTICLNKISSNASSMQLVHNGIMHYSTLIWSTMVLCIR